MLAWIHCSLSAVSVDEGTSARSVDQSLNSTGVQEVLYQEVIVLYCDWFTNIQQHITSYPGS